MAFGAVVLVVYCLVLPAVGVFSALRSSTALLPVVSVVVVVAILRAARTRQLAGVLTGTVIAIYLVSGVMDDRRSIDPMNQIGNADRAQARGAGGHGMRRRMGLGVHAGDDAGSCSVFSHDRVSSNPNAG